MQGNPTLAELVDLTKEELWIKFGELDLPEYMWQPLEGYFFYNLQPGRFLYAIVNDLSFAEVIESADHFNRSYLRQWAELSFFLHHKRRLADRLHGLYRS